MPTPRHDLIGHAAIADYLGVTRMTVYTWIRRRGCPVATIGRCWRANSHDLDAWIDAHKKSLRDSLHYR